MRKSQKKLKRQKNYLRRKDLDQIRKDKQLKSKAEEQKRKDVDLTVREEEQRIKDKKENKKKYKELWEQK